MSKFKYSLFFLLFIGISLSAGTKHPLHVSTTEVNYNAKEKNLEISCRIFSDDFEAVLSKLYKQKTDLSNPALKNGMDELVKKYLATHVQLRVNGKTVVMNYLGFEQDHEATNVYLEVPKTAAVKSMEITDTILYDQFEDQMSIVHLVNGSLRKSSKILYPDRKFAANF